MCAHDQTTNIVKYVLDGTCFGPPVDHTLALTALSIGICDCICVIFLLTEGDKGDDDNRTEILFDRLMLMELREIMGKLDPKSYAELRSYNEPPKVIKSVIDRDGATCRNSNRLDTQPF